MPQPVPILVGAGQNTIRAKSVDDFMHPIDAMKLVVERAAEDAGTRALIERADALHVVYMLSWNHKDAPTALAEALDIKPATKEYTAIGGNSPQWLVNRAADNIAAGRSEIAILAGCEVMRSVSLAMAAGKDLGFFRDKVEVPLVGIVREGVTEIEKNHFADRPIRIYPLFENALRAKEGLTLDQHRAVLGKWGEEYTAVAARNPYAWFQIARTAEEVATPSDKNRMIAFPYTKYLNAIMAVDQSAAVIMTTTETARRLGIPESKWVYLHGGQDAHDLWFVSERPDLADSPAIKACVDDALDQAQLALDEIDFFDFYSCFPCMPRISRRMLGMADDDPRPMTITGGLPYFGGAGNNYVMHSIAKAMDLCRADANLFGMITANGYYCTKHGVGIYSAQPPKREWKRTPPEQFQNEMPLPSAIETDPEPSGELVVESYTVWHGRDGEPETGIVVGRLPNNRRAWAQTPKRDLDVLNAMMNEEWIGKRGRLRGREGAVNIVEFS